MARQPREEKHNRDSVKQEKRQDRDGTRHTYLLIVLTISLSQTDGQEHQLTILSVSTQRNTTQHN